VVLSVPPPDHDPDIGVKGEAACTALLGRHSDANSNHPARVMWDPDI
jgi:hypothetical protein